MEKIKKIINKIKEFLNNLIGNTSTPLLNEYNYQDEEVEYNRLDYQEEKKYTLELYENIKNGYVEIDDLMINDLIKILMLEQEELNIQDLKIEKLEEEINQLEKEKLMLSNGQKY